MWENAIILDNHYYYVGKSTKWGKLLSCKETIWENAYHGNTLNRKMLPSKETIWGNTLSWITELIWAKSKHEWYRLCKCGHFNVSGGLWWSVAAVRPSSVPYTIHIKCSFIPCWISILIVLFDIDLLVDTFHNSSSRNFGILIFWWNYVVFNEPKFPI